MASSQNGWVANDQSKTESILVPYTNVKLRVRKDSPGLVLIQTALAFDRLVEDIDNGRGELDDWGYAERPVRGSATVLSNHASGTAIDLNAPKHPLGKKNTFSATQVTRIREIIAVTENVVTWGGVWNRPDEMHFEISDGMTMAQCERALDRMRAFNGANNGTIVAPGPTPVVAGDLLKKGMPGPNADVKTLQRVLNAWYPWLNLVEDGWFGQKTEDAVKHLQRNARIADDGVVGKVTREVLGI